MNIVKFCSCRACRSGKHSKPSKARTRKAMRSARRSWNLAATREDDEKATLPISIPYTD